jgi:hypothetical protein
MNDDKILAQLKQFKKQVIYNEKQSRKLQRLIYLLMNKIKLYVGKNGGIYYYVNNKKKNSKIYIQ